MSNYIQLKKQIIKLQRDAEIALRRERAEVIAKVRKAIIVYKLSAEDLGLTEASRGRRVRSNSGGSEAVNGPKRRSDTLMELSVPGGQQRRKAGKRSAYKSASTDKRSVVAPKYRDLSTGATWAGRGKQPGWLVLALNSGKKLEDFKI